MKTWHVLSILWLATVGGVAQAAPFTVSADGTEVTDSKTGLVWRRCAEGMVAGVGGCTGAALGFTQEAALARAQDQAASTGVAWRLPNVKELSSIVDRSKSNPSIDTAAFPAVPADWFWSSSPYVAKTNLAWTVSFKDGEVISDVRRLSSYPVRLVRAGQ